MHKITQKPSPNFWAERRYPPIIAIVHHRMVGYLPGTDSWFSNPANQVSAHFGIGYRNSGEPVEISQYVDLAHSAWTAGNYDSSGGWPLIKKSASGTVLNPNWYIIGVEHEDGGPNDGRVSEGVLKASLWLDYILLSGRIDLMNYVGIKNSDPVIATQLGNIIPDTETLIDHNRISGIKKPYCWRPYKLDITGFPGWQPRLLDYIRSTAVAIEDVLDLLDQEVQKLQAERDAAIVQATAAEAKITKAKTIASTIYSYTDALDQLADEISTL